MGRFRPYSRILDLSEEVCQNSNTQAYHLIKNIVVQAGICDIRLRENISSTQAYNSIKNIVVQAGICDVRSKENILVFNETK